MAASMLPSAPVAKQVPASVTEVPTLRPVDTLPMHTASPLPAVTVVKAAKAAADSSRATPVSQPVSAAAVQVSLPSPVQQAVVSSGNIRASSATPASDAQRTGQALLQSSAPAPLQMSTAIAPPLHPSPSPLVTAPSRAHAETAPKAPLPTALEVPTGTPEGAALSPPAEAVMEVETAQLAALPSAYASLPAQVPAAKSKSMQPRSVAMGASKVPLKVIRPQLPGMNNTPSASLAGASTLLGEARPQPEATTVSAVQINATSKHSVPVDPPPPSSSAGIAAVKPAAMALGPSGVASGQHDTALKKTNAAQVEKAPPSVLHAVPAGEAPLAVTPMAATLLAASPMATGPEQQGSGPQAAIAERSQSQAAIASKSKVEEHNRVGDRCD